MNFRIFFLFFGVCVCVWGGGGGGGWLLAMVGLKIGWTHDTWGLLNLSTRYGIVSLLATAPMVIWYVLEFYSHCTFCVYYERWVSNPWYSLLALPCRGIYSIIEQLLKNSIDLYFSAKRVAIHNVILNSGPLAQYRVERPWSSPNQAFLSLRHWAFTLIERSHYIRQCRPIIHELLNISQSKRFTITWNTAYI